MSWKNILNKTYSNSSSFYGFGPLCCKSIEQRPWSYLFHNKIFQENTQYSNLEMSHTNSWMDWKLNQITNFLFPKQHSSLGFAPLKFPNWWERIKTRVQQSKAFEEMEYFRYLNYNFAESIIDLTFKNAILKYHIDYIMIIEFRNI